MVQYRANVRNTCNHLQVEFSDKRAGRDVGAEKSEKEGKSVTIAHEEGIKSTAYIFQINVLIE